MLVIALQVAGIAFFGVALSFVLVSQIYSLVDCFSVRKRGNPIVAVMPDWRFFAPKPVTGGRHILAETPDGWREVWSADPGDGPRRLLRMVWNPPRRSAACVYQAEAIMINDHTAGRQLGRSAGLEILALATRSMTSLEGLQASRGAVTISQAGGLDGPTVYQLVVAFDLDDDAR